MSKFEHVCGLQGYCPGPPHNDPICPACLLRGKDNLRLKVEGCPRCHEYSLCDQHTKEAMERVLCGTCGKPYHYPTPCIRGRS